jgi:leader peptidase (prepilin peptidase)/N-methyltransferase
MIRTLCTILAGLLGLAFGSFLNVCLSRWPEGESVVKPRSHCRNCGRTLAWWENVPLLSWIALRGRCRTCQSKISWRYPLVELAVAGLWALSAWNSIPEFPLLPVAEKEAIAGAVAMMIFSWLLIALAILDAENLWLPNFLTYPGIIVGLVFTTIFRAVGNDLFQPAHPIYFFWKRLGSAAAAAALILLIRWTYRLIRRREGIGLGDAKLMAMLGAWLGLSGALLSFAIGVMLGSLFALVVLAVPAARRQSDTWLQSKLPLGTFLCVGGIVSALWGQPIIAAYMRWVGLT